jgi:hypothetical protein
MSFRRFEQPLVDNVVVQLMAVRRFKQARLDNVFVQLMALRRFGQQFGGQRLRDMALRRFEQPWVDNVFVQLMALQRLGQPLVNYISVQGGATLPQMLFIAAILLVPARSR